VRELFVARQKPKLEAEYNQQINNNDALPSVEDGWVHEVTKAHSVTSERAHLNGLLLFCFPFKVGKTRTAWPLRVGLQGEGFDLPQPARIR
jgi:hypothetical protein